MCSAKISVLSPGPAEGQHVHHFQHAEDVDQPHHQGDGDDVHHHRQLDAHRLLPPARTVDARLGSVWR